MFKTYTLSSSKIEIEIIPELGGKVSRLIDVATGRDWMWQAPDRGLHANRLGDSFPESTLLGADECFPTVAACEWRGRPLPDHGELWCTPMQVEAFDEKKLSLAVECPLSPFRFERSVVVDDEGVCLQYRVENTGTEPEPYLWAFHPMMKIETGDRLELPFTSARIDSAINLPRSERGERIDYPGAFEGVSLDRMDFGPHAPAAIKVFSDKLDEGEVALIHANGGRRLRFHFDRKELNTLGVWINPGGWADYHHAAIEPTNGAPDLLDVAVEWKRCTWVEPGRSVSWSFRLAFASA